MEEKIVCVLELKPGEKGEFYKILPREEKECEHSHRHGHSHESREKDTNDSHKRCIERLFEAVGIYEGQVIEVVENPGHGPIILKTDDGSKITLGRGQASSVFVKKIEK